MSLGVLMVERLLCTLGTENLEFITTEFVTNSIHTKKFVQMSLGDWSGGATPGPIPNPEVKSASADGTWPATAWESRSLPRDFYFITINP